MNVTITEKALNLYIKEMELQEGDFLRLYVRVGGCGSGGFSVGVTKDFPRENAFTTTVAKITFFVEEEDFWYLDGMTIDYDEDLNCVTFTNPKIDNTENLNS